MNAQAHVAGQVSNPGGVQLSGHMQQMSNSLPSMQNLVGQIQSRDADLAQRRANVRDYCLKYLQRKLNSTYELSLKLPDIARRLEERIFKEASAKDDYFKLGPATIEHCLHSLTMSLNNSSHYKSASVGTMIPTPGFTPNGNILPLVSGSSDTSMVSSDGRGLANGLGIVVGNSTATISNGQVPNSFGIVASNVSAGSKGNNNILTNIVMQASNQMIPTPGFNNIQQMSSASGLSNGVGPMSADIAPVPNRQLRQFSRNQTGHIVQNVGIQMAGRMRPSVLQNPSSYGFLPNGVLNGHNASEGYLGVSSYGSSPKPLQGHFDELHQQSTMSTSIPQQIMSMTGGEEYMLNPVDLTGSSSLYGTQSSTTTEIHNLNINHTSLHSKSTSNAVIEGSNLGPQSIRQSAQLKPRSLDQPQNVSVQSANSIRNHMSQLQHQLSNVQHHFSQQPNQPQHQQILSRTDFSRQNSIVSHIPGQFNELSGETNSLLLQQSAEQFHVSDMQRQFNQGSLNILSGSEDFQHSIQQDFQQALPLKQDIVNSHGDYTGLLNLPQSGPPLQGHWRPQPRQVNMVEKLSVEQQIIKDFNQRVTGQEEAQQMVSSLEERANCYATTPGKVFSGRSERGSVDPKREQDYLKQRRWILLLLHSRRCPAPHGSCKEVNCVTVQDLWLHMGNCNSDHCRFARCYSSRKLFKHYMGCRSASCPVCGPVREFIVAAENRYLSLCQSNCNNILSEQTSGSWKPANTNDIPNGMTLKASVSLSETCSDQQSLSKRLKTQHVSNSPVFVHVGNQLLAQEMQQSNGFLQVEKPVSIKSETIEVKNNFTVVSGLGDHSLAVDIDSHMENVCIDRSDCDFGHSNEIDNVVKQERTLGDSQNALTKNEANQETSAPIVDSAVGSKSGKPTIKGVSLIELFTPEQVREHIMGLRQWVGQSKAKAEKNQAMEHSMSENSCQLCAVEKLTFEPPPIYCSPCGARIKRNVMYYTIGSGDTRHCFCIPCYNEARGDNIEVDGSAFSKSKLEKKRNDEETEEWWVQCDKCEAWQHQICALFNGRRNDGGQAEYTCPNCYIVEVERGERSPLPLTSVLGAKDLPRTLLSDHIEQRLFRRLKEERNERAKQLGRAYDEVPGAENLVIRVVSSVDKKLDVKQRFLEIFQEDNYPTEFAYKSKVVLLFQKIEGVEVCLFGMYVQEFGSECPFPNQRRVYLSYLDSVKYFRPEIKTVTGEALRTFVYHEILIGYLEYCKKRGFTSCYIWACPPLKGEDYILYCHPEIQKTPKSDKLREWYLSMLRKASKENIVVELTNLYDHFFIPMGECKAKVTAARLPYFDGDYWPGAAEDMINQLRQVEDGRNLHKKGKTKKTITKRALKAAGQTDLTGNASKDALLMQKLGETIYPMKEDFIMVHLQHACTHCCILMVSGTRWVCRQCKNFQLCDRCHDAEQKLEDRERHPINSREKHALCPIEINAVRQDTKDKDEILESEFFDTRQAFLSLCQGNHYQYDTLRRAKHSSMMVLYHLHNPTAPAFVTPCNVCHHDIEAGQGWRCEVCPDFDVCNSCYQKDGCVDHPHRLTKHPSMAERDAQNKEARQKRVLQLRKMLDLLVHASQCRISLCHYPNCRKVKGLFRHGIQCKVRISGGCALCKKMWHLLQLHARACKVSECVVPRCKDLKEHLRRLQQQTDSRRRAAVMEMMRQRAVEVAGNNE